MYGTEAEVCQCRFSGQGGGRDEASVPPDSPVVLDETGAPVGREVSLSSR